MCNSTTLKNIMTSMKGEIFNFFSEAIRKCIGERLQEKFLLIQKLFISLTKLSMIKRVKVWIRNSLSVELPSQNLPRLSSFHRHQALTLILVSVVLIWCHHFLGM
jgi:hypothetical protein